jgi:gamma-glutamylcyclotransferase (GGCT)/AIG2-like uncharacterized protein YtfP
VCLGEASIAGTLYDLGAYPGVVLGGAGRVKGEVYVVEPSVEAALDVLEEVADDDSGEYIKRRVRVEVGAQWSIAWSTRSIRRASRVGG